MLDLKNKRSVLNELSRCSRCGFCLSVCPTYKASLIETSAARGRNVILRAILEGRMDQGRGITDTISSCLLCRACEVSCPAGIRTDLLMVAGRYSSKAYGMEGGLAGIIFKKILPHRHCLSLLLKLLSLGKITGIAKISRYTGILRMISPYLDNAEELVEDIPLLSLRERLNGSISNPEKKVKGKLAYFLGCGVNYLLPEVGLSTLGLLESLGFMVVVPDNICCGLPPYTYGDIDAARLLAGRNMDVLSSLDVENIITDCASCSSFLKEYPLLFSCDNKKMEEAVKISQKVADITSFLFHLGEEKGSGFDGKIVTWHDPCHLSRFQGIVKEPREVIKKIKGIEFREMEEADLCCGGAGTYNIRQNDLSMKILDKKVEHIVRSGAEIVATSCPSCIIQLNYGLRKNNLPVKAVHITQLLK